MTVEAARAATKAVILARGLGTRMRRHDVDADLTAEQRAEADAGIKAMISVGRPFLDYVLSALADAGITEVCLVIGPEHARIRERYIKDVAVTRLRIAFSVQAKARGTADAVLAARAFTGEEGFLVLNADNYYPVDAYRLLRDLRAPGLPGFRRDALVRLSNIGADRIRQYALLQVDCDGWLTDIVEKPDEHEFASAGPDALVSMNLWSFSPAIFEACERIVPSVRGELELPNAVRFAVREMRERLRVIPVSLGVLDLSRRADIAAVAERLRGVQVSL